MARSGEQKTPGLALCGAWAVYTRTGHRVYCTELRHPADLDHRGVVTDLDARDHEGKVPLVRPTLPASWADGIVTLLFP